MPGHKTAAAFLASVALAACAHTPAATPAHEFTIADPTKAGWNADALADLASYAQSQKTTGFLIIQNRKVIYEHNWPLAADAEQFEKNFTYGPAADGALQEDVASQQKSFIAILAGVASDKGTAGRVEARDSVPRRRMVEGSAGSGSEDYHPQPDADEFGP